MTVSGFSFTSAYIPSRKATLPREVFPECIAVRLLKRRILLRHCGVGEGRQSTPESPIRAVIPRSPSGSKPEAWMHGKQALRAVVIGELIELRPSARIQAGYL